MNIERIEWFKSNEKLFGEIYVKQVFAALSKLTDKQFSLVKNTKFKKPNVACALCVVLGVDHFYLGDVVGGLIRLFTLNGLGFLYFSDVKTVKDRTYEANAQMFFEIANH